MNTTDFTTTLLVDQTPKEVFQAVINPRKWWSEEIEGSTDQLNDVFNYHFEDIHRCQIKLIEVIPNKKVVWHVIDNYFKPGIFDEASPRLNNHELPDEKAEWVDTTISFEIAPKDNQTQIRFTHHGLFPHMNVLMFALMGGVIIYSRVYFILSPPAKANQTAQAMLRHPMKKNFSLLNK